ncbi:MAG: Hsp33 family molecular chaperone HslO [Thermodesulfobacteriota bacterium]
MLHQSQLYTFIDKDKKFALYFLEGQKLIHDLVLTHNPRRAGFSYFRTIVLSVQLMLGLLKQRESFCVYIDSESPYFRLKIEMNAMGLMRAMMYSDLLDSTPENVSGQLRLLKFLPSSEIPYQSIVSLDGVDAGEIINEVLQRSYQVKSRLSVSQDSDQSFMLHQLPLSAKETPADIDTVFAQYAGPLNDVMKQALMDEDAIIGAMEKIGFKFLASKPVEFKCGCSKQQMIENLKRVANTSEEPLFGPGEDVLETLCQYCNTAYPITKQEVEASPPDNQ